MGLRPTQGDEKRLLSSNALYGSGALPFVIPKRSRGTASLTFVIPSAAEGSAVPRTFLGNVFRPERSGVEGSAVAMSISGHNPFGSDLKFPGQQLRQENKKFFWFAFCSL